ncbi:MAG: hypothetical protein JRH16_12075 [Deltaproteobacteria bacterium]|nr:hypothetical protein [Deltaproteobacteria bacterium]MBW2361763.1 hypothetical protein [Deltaproteobacteria bacterium]
MTARNLTTQSGIALVISLCVLSPTVSRAQDIALPSPHPWAADGPYPMSHHNSGQTDVTVVNGPTQGRKLTREDAKSVPVVWCSAPIVKKVGDHTTVIAGTPHGLAKIDATGEAFDLVSFMPYPGLEEEHSDVTHEDIAWHMDRINEKRREKQDWRLLFHSAYMLWGLELNMRNGGSGAYGVIDKDGYHYTFFDATRIVKSFDDNERSKPLRPIRDVGVTDGLADEIAKRVTRILSITLTYDGHLAVAAKGGLFVFDRELGLKDYLLFPDEHVENSIAVDEKRIYVVTSKYMRGVAWDGEKLSLNEADGGWTSEYDVMPEGEAIKRGAASHGSGTTPTLMGFGDDEDHLVVISDGSPDGAQLVAFWRDEIPVDFVQKNGTRSRRIADQIRLQMSPLTVEASPAAYGTGVIVLNSTYPDSAPAPLNILGNAFLAGETREPPLGAQKFEWKPDENRFVEGWFLEDIDNTDWMPPAISPHNGIAYVATKVDSVYEYRGIDFATGETVARWTFPDDSVLWNNWGGITTLLEDGDLLLGGFFAVKRYNIGHLR